MNHCGLCCGFVCYTGGVQMGELYRREVLQHGNARCPNEMLRSMMQEEPSSDALIEEYLDG